VKKEQFRLLQGKDLIRVYGKGQGAVKAFCINCGSSLFGGDWPATRYQFGWEPSTMIPGFVLNFTRSSMIARHGIRSTTSYRNIAELGVRMRNQARVKRPSL
jgi:hypothetical protein